MKGKESERMSNKGYKPILVRQGTYEALKELAQKEGLTLLSIVDKVLKQYLEKVE